ncbi:SAM-dependent methyltransferase [Ruminiclostridium herbifermentans]|uniref:SAM-dependent methyltransferase n=1 Tax=Ruminiclostridium herbifermentans TaxID=2488810 RepID=A0A4U7J8W3_9FIRM|nr:SAM-dependent methyltransferase [Ruminiclostridium herbifermentans]QNU68780.1 SAM-dependent methyltransferase [Ruminiclostridium herbifermentans]
MDEQYYEKLLKIKTTGEQKIFNDSIHYHRYEPTSYAALEALSSAYKFSSEDSIVDFGCGKGRLNFYINHFFDSFVTGIEMNKFFYKQAVENKKSYLQIYKNRKDKIVFSNCLAERYNIDLKDNKFYFFNPFSIQIFSKVIKNIMASVEENKRTIDIILYYPSNDYIYFLDTNSSFVLINEIKVQYLYDNDPRHKFLVYRVEHYK